MKLEWEKIKEIRRGRIVTVDNKFVSNNYQNIVSIGGEFYIKLDDIPFSIRDLLEDVEDYEGELYGKLITALELAGKEETDENYLYQKKVIENIILEETRLIPTIVNDEVYVGLELTLKEVEKRYFEGEPEQFIAGKIRIQKLLDEKFDNYILERKQEQFEAYKKRIKETTNVKRRTKLEEYLKSKLFDIKMLSIPELKSIENFSFKELDNVRKQKFLEKIKNNYDRLQQYSDEFLDLINIKVLGNVANSLRKKILDRINSALLSNDEKKIKYYSVEKKIIEQGLLVRLFKQPLSQKEFLERHGKTVDETKKDLNKRRTLFQRHLGREILDKFLSVDLEENEEQTILVNAEKTKKSIRKVYYFGDETDELGVIRHKLDAKDIVNVKEIFDYSIQLLTPRIESIKSEVLFEDPYLNSLKASWLYTNAAIIEWYEKIQAKNLKTNEEKTENLALTLHKLAKKFQTRTNNEKDDKRLERVTKTLSNAAGRQKMLEEKIIGIFDKKKRNKLMKELGG